MRHRSIAVTATALLATVAGLGGAATATPPPAASQVIIDGQAQPVFSAKPSDWIVREAWVQVPVDSDGDGVRDRAHFRYAVAKDAPARVPVIMVASPYWTGVNEVPNHNVNHDLYDPATPNRSADAGAGSTRADVQLFDRWSAATWISRGFGWVEFEALGTGGSTGCPTTGGANETLGPKAAIDWLNGRATAVDKNGAAVTAGWSDGRVGMIGTSYDGTLPNAVATTGVEGLRAIIPVSAISDWYGYYRAGGAVVAPAGYQGEDADVLAKFVLTRSNPKTCTGVINSLARQQDRLTGDYSTFWQQRSYLANVANVKAAVYVAHGLDDWNVKPSQAGLWYRALRAQGTPAKIYWHQGGHGGEPSLYEQNRWFTRYLLGVRNGVENDPRAIIRNPTGKLIRYAEWPLPASAPPEHCPRRPHAARGHAEPDGHLRRRSLPDPRELHPDPRCPIRPGSGHETPDPQHPPVGIRHRRPSARPGPGQCQSQRRHPRPCSQRPHGVGDPRLGRPAEPHVDLAHRPDHARPVPAGARRSRSQ